MATLSITKSDPNGYASLGYASVIIYAGVTLGSGTVTSFGLHVLDKVGVAVANHGTLNASTGADLYGGGFFHNYGDGKITGNLGVVFDAFSTGANTLINQGVIDVTGSGVEFFHGGSVVNYGNIHGSQGQGVSVHDDGGVVDNYGSIGGGGGAGVQLYAGGSVTNGALALPNKLIDGLDAGIQAGAIDTTISNFGRVVATSAVSIGVRLDGGGVVTNGAPLDTRAMISGALDGIQASGGAATVTNFGAILGSPVIYGIGISLAAGGLVTNGTATDRAALVEGRYGIVAQSATIRNYGEIRGVGGTGLSLDFGVFQNGAANDRTATIEGDTGVSLYQVTTATNDGLILGGRYGLILRTTTLSNGGPGQTSALIEGQLGASVAAGLLRNYGTVEGSLQQGVVLRLGATLDNFGTVIGDTGAAVTLIDPSETLIVEAGCAFTGSILGGGGTLELGSGKGTLTGLLAGNNVTVSGSMATTTFDNFATVQIDKGASFALTGAGGTIAAAQALKVLGTLSGAGTLALTGGTATFGAGASLTISKVTEAAGATAAFTAPVLTVSDRWTQTAGTITVAAADRVNFAGVGDVFSGTLTGAGSVNFTAGTDALTGTTLSAAQVVVAGGAVSLSGTIALTKSLTVTSPALTIAAAGASLTGGGTVSLNSATSAIKGATATATLTNVGDRIAGAGKLGSGQLTLVNAAAGVIVGNLATALV
ncbi:MAG TPA: hypothetical protein VIC62_00470, partial [Nakamurella sp.]